MKFLKALVTEVTASKEKKVSIHVEELIAETLTALRAVDQQFQSSAREIAAACRELVIALPRGQEGHDRAYKLYFDLKEKRSPLHASPWIASRLIMADHVVASAGSKGLSSLGGVSLIQGYIEAFFERQKVPAWKAPYFEYGFFDAHREQADTTPGPPLTATTIDTLLGATRVAKEAQEIMTIAMQDIPSEQLTRSDDSALAASSFLAGLAIALSQRHGVSDANLHLVVEATLKQRVGATVAEHYANNLQMFMDDPQARLGINAGRVAGSLTADDGVTPAVLLQSLLRKTEAAATP